MKKLVLLSLLSATLFSCSDEKVEIPVQNAQNLPISGACSFELQKSDPTGKGAIWNWEDYRWPNQSIIKVKFLGNDGTNTDLKSRIKRYANLWLRHANVNFEFVSSTSDADIKIVAGNEGSTGNWSYCGIYCKRLAQNVPTMSIGDLNVNGTESWLRATVLHEFGHALGLIHEHKSPNCDKSNWNKEAIISRYIAEQGWTRDYVIQQIFNNEDPYWLDVSTYDRNSIMHYPFSASELGTATGIDNRDLSVIDMNFMSGKYQFGNIRNIYRFYYNGIHNYNPNAYDKPEQFTEGILGRISMSQIPNTFPLRRFERSNGDSYFTFAASMPNNPEYTFKELIGYAFNTQQPGTVPVHQYWGNNHHFYTLDLAELGNGGYGYSKEPTFIYLYR